MTMMTKLLATLLMAAATSPALAAEAALTVQFDPVEIAGGQIMLSLFDSEAAYDKGEPVRAAAVPVVNGKASVIFNGLAPGRYAVKAFHDIDGNGDMATNPFGMPIEPFAFSNNARAEGGPARWSAASFDVGAGSAVVTIAIK